MNTTPDDELMGLWVDDALKGPPAAEVEAWAAARPEWLERRELARRLTPVLRNGLAVTDLPYPDFFNARIAREIAREAGGAGGAVSPLAVHPVSLWRWFLPATAVAGMVLCFWAGTRMVGIPASPVPTPVAAAFSPYLYTPEKGVKADYFASEPAGAMVIVLDGVAAIPDSFEIPDTAAVRPPPAATADIDTAAP